MIKRYRAYELLIKELEEDKKTVEGFNFQLSNRITELEKQIQELKEALQFYADIEIYKTYRDGKYEPTIIYRDILKDAGQKAREVLNKYKD